MQNGVLLPQLTVVVTMLEFIVLGHIPGTDFQLTFQQIALFAALLVTGLIGASHIDASLKRLRDTQNQLKETAL